MLKKIGRGFEFLGSGLHAMSKAQAQWEIELGRTILARRKKILLIALAPVIVGLVWSSASGQPSQLVTNAATAPASASAPATGRPAIGTDDSLPQKIPILGGSKAFMPSPVTPKMFFGSILVGLIAGLITGVIGAGGGYILTPALMSFGVRGIMSVGTDQFHLFAKAIMGTAIHRKLGNVNLRLAAWFVVGSFGGVTLGGQISRAIFAYSPALSDTVISMTYVIMLGILGVYAVIDWLRLRKGSAGVTDVDATTSFAKWLQKLPLRPRVTFDTAIVPQGRSICIYPIIICGFIVGFVASIVGVGGGFLAFPLFVSGMGVSTFTTVGTSILQIIFTTAYSSIVQYAFYGYIIYTIAIGMLIGSLIGVQVGSLVTNVVKGSQIRAFFALTILAGFFNRLCALPRKLADMGYISLSHDAGVWIENVGVVLFFAIVGLFALWIIVVFISKLRLMRRDRTNLLISPGGPVIVDRAKFAMGLGGLAVFAVLLAVGAGWSRNGKSLLDWTDGFFNQVAKNSANYIPQAQKQSEAFAELPIDIGIHPHEMVDDRKMRSVISDSGCQVTVGDDGRTRIRGKMSQLSRAALADAELAFKNDFKKLKDAHGIDANQVIYCWWIIFDSLSKRYVQENQAAPADFAKFMSAKVLEPAYNFRGIEAKSSRNNILPLTGLLVFYIIYTLWYGYSILLLMEGFGITMTVTKGRKEI